MTLPQTILFLPTDREVVANPEVALAVEHGFAARVIPAAVELQRQHPSARGPIEVRHERNRTQVFALRDRIEFVHQSEEPLWLIPRIASDKLGSCQRVGWSAPLRRRGRYEKPVASIGCYQHRASGEHVRERREIGHCWRLGTVEWVLNSGTPPAGLKINEVGHIACCNTQAERGTFDRGAVKKLIVRPHRRHGGHFVDNDLVRRRLAQHAQ